MIDADREVGDDPQAVWQPTDRLLGEMLGVARQEGVGVLREISYNFV